MPLNLRILQHNPIRGYRVWDAILMDERQNVRLHTDDGGFIDITIMAGEHYHPENIAPIKERQVVAKNSAVSEKARARRRLRNKRKKASKNAAR